MGVNGNNPKSAKKQRKFQPQVGTEGVADWKSADGQAVVDAIEAISRHGEPSDLGTHETGERTPSESMGMATHTPSMLDLMKTSRQFCANSKRHSTNELQGLVSGDGRRGSA